MNEIKVFIIMKNTYGITEKHTHETGDIIYTMFIAVMTISDSVNGNTSISRVIIVVYKIDVKVFI